jgi:predicted ATPase
MAKGRALEEIFASADDERAMKDWQWQAEHELRAADIVFLDRALPDYLWFWRVHELDPNELLPECLHFRYATVFILDQLPLEMDGARIEDETFRGLFDVCLDRDYRALGYDIVRVPVLSPQERVEFVLGRLSLSPSHAMCQHRY